jgi:hypothetical protein
MANAHEAINLWCETVIEDGQDIPPAKSISMHQQDPEFAGWVWAVGMYRLRSTWAQRRRSTSRCRKSC